MTKKLYIKTYGCQMNVYDSQRMEDALAPMGYVNSETPEGAELVILNTCHIREKATEKVYSELGQIRRMKDRMEQHGQRMLIAVAGCVGQAEGEVILKRAPYVDIVVGPQSYQQMPDLVSQCLRDHTSRVLLEFDTEDKFDQLPEERVHKTTQAFLSIQEGCDKFCTFCVVPYTRGAEYSRPVADVLREAERLVGEGAVELTLLGQNVNAYHGHDAEGAEWGLARLVRRLAEIDGLARIRYTTSHPRDMEDDLIAAHGEVPELMPYLHLPVQSGSDRILKRMNRKHTAADYMRIIERLRKAQPEMALSSDFIVGFPGESDADFQETMKLVRDVEYAQAYSFKYSMRPGTPAAEQAEQVPEAVKTERLAELQDVLGQQTRRFNDSCVDRIIPVLIEKTGREAREMVGRSPYMQPVHFHDTDLVVGTMLQAKITQALGFSLRAQIVNTSATSMVYTEDVHKSTRTIGAAA